MDNDSNDVQCVLARLVDCTCILVDNRNYFCGDTFDAMSNPFQRACYQLGFELASLYNTDLKNLDRSNLRNTSIYQKIYLCPICRKFKSESRSVLCQHLYMPHVIQPRKLLCNICAQDFSTRTDVQCHIIEKHMITPVLPPPHKSYSCQLCPYDVTNKHSFLRHFEKCKLMNSASMIDSQAQAIDITDTFDYYESRVYPPLDILLHQQECLGGSNTKIQNSQFVSKNNSLQNPLQPTNMYSNVPLKSNFDTMKLNTLSYNGFNANLVSTSFRPQETSMCDRALGLTTPTKIEYNRPAILSSTFNGTHHPRYKSVHSDYLPNDTFQLIEPILSKMNCHNRIVNSPLYINPIQQNEHLQSHNKLHPAIISQSHLSQLLSKAFSCNQQRKGEYSDCNLIPNINTRIPNAAFNEVLSIEQLKDIFKDRSVHNEIDRILYALKELNTKINWQKYVEVSEVRSVAGRCTFCPNISFIPDIIQHHRVAHNMQIKYFQSNKICIICSVIMPDVTTLIHHQQVVHNMIPMCSIERILQFQLSNSYNSKPERNNAAKSEHRFVKPPESKKPQTIQPPVSKVLNKCNSSMSFQSAVKSVAKTQPRQYFCKKCLLTDLDLATLCQHLKENHDVEIRLLRNCLICGAKVREGKELEAHHRNHLIPCTINLTSVNIESYSNLPPQKRRAIFSNDFCVDVCRTAKETRSLTKASEQPMQFEEIVLD